MTRIPRDAAPDRTLGFLADPYRFIGKRARALDTDLFETRLLGQRTLCLTGREAGRLFYDTTRMRRAGAMPGRIVKTLLGEGGVQSLDGDLHRLRKALFLALATGDGLARLLALVERQWAVHTRLWAAAGQVRLYDGAIALLSQAAFEWVGLPLDDRAVAARTPDVAALFDGAGAVGPRHWKARLARRRLEAWLTEVAHAVRHGVWQVHPAAPLARLVAHRDADGQTLSDRIVAVELLNLIRPVIAVAVYITFVAHALQRSPAARAYVRVGDAARERFAEEVRRFYPFFPAVAARTCVAFTWRDFEIPADVRVMFDLYGTNHDPRHWTSPECFDPARFETAFDARFGFVPQGGGDHETGHRCPGEWITVALMTQATAWLAERMAWSADGAPEIAMTRVPALPEGGMTLRQVRCRHGGPAEH